MENTETREQTMAKIEFHLPTLTDEQLRKEEMIQAAMEAMRKLYYEDMEFFYKFITGYAAKKGYSIYINIITRQLDGPGVNRGSSSGSSSGGAVDFNSVYSARSIPYLASGAVIPPNAPFTAVLGDQKHGVNVEAPLATIQEAVAQVLGDLGPSTLAGFEAVVEKQNEILSAIQDIQIGDTTIGRAAARFDRRQNLIRGGSPG